MRLRAHKIVRIRYAGVTHVAVRHHCIPFHCTLLTCTRPLIGFPPLPQGEFKIPKKPTTMSENGELDEQRHMRDGSDSGSEWEDEDDEDDGLPSYEFRFECAKMLLELEDTVDTAIQVG